MKRKEDNITMAKKFEIRNSTAEFLTFVATGKEEGIQVLYKDETIWATQKAMATLFDVDRSVITKHLKNIFDSNELTMEQVCAKFAHTAEDGKTYQTQFYNLDAILQDAGKITAEFAKRFAESEFEKYRIIQDKLFQSDFDRLTNGDTHFLGDYF